MTDCVEKEYCRASGRPLMNVLDLGELCLNAFPSPGEPDAPAYPLVLAYARDSELVQLRHSVDPELMYRQYWYASSTNESMAAHLKDVVVKAQAHLSKPLAPGDWVIDIGSNDGTLLGYYPGWVRRMGFEPARNVAAPLRRGQVIVHDFYKPADAERHLKGSKARIITSIAMFYDLDNPVETALHIASQLADDGVWILEMHYLPQMLALNEVDAICHEHLCYYSLVSLEYTLRQAGVTITDVELNDINGGSMLVFARKAAYAGAPSAEILNMMAQEERVPAVTRLVEFADRVKANRLELRALLTELVTSGKKVYGYGASTKGNTLLQYCGITPDFVQKIADRNPAKHGHETVGTRIPIISEEQMRAERPDYLLMLPYHFKETFYEREQEFLKSGGRFITPVPKPQIVEW